MRRESRDDTCSLVFRKLTSRYTYHTILDKLRDDGWAEALVYMAIYSAKDECKLKALPEVRKTQALTHQSKLNMIETWLHH